MPNLTYEELENIIVEELAGIDRDEIEADNGWWETSTGGEFGAARLKALLDRVRQLCDERSADERFEARTHD